MCELWINIKYVYMLQFEETSQKEVIQYRVFDLTFTKQSTVQYSTNCYISIATQLNIFTFLGSRVLHKFHNQCKYLLWQ